MVRKKFSCDFETTTKIDDCRVWAFGVMEIGKKSNRIIGNSIEEFMVWMEHSQSDLYFHNLRFDGEFIVNWLLKNGYKWDKSGRAKTFSTVISSMGQWYKINICYGYKGKKKLHTVIYDSYKKLPFPVKGIAKDFNLKIEKGDIDYHTERPVGHVITDEELVYINNDIEIIADALEIQFNQGLKAMTNGGDSLKGFKEIFTTQMFEHHFPIVSLETNENFRLAYRGGFTWMNERFTDVEIGEGIVFDVNSLYPAVMYDRELPYGLPMKYYGEYEYDEDFPLYIQQIKFEFQVKEGHIPTIQLKNNPRFYGRGSEYLKSSGGESVEMYVTNIDLNLILEHYDVYDIEYLSGWKFRSKTGMFTKFIDKWTYIKTTSDGAIRLLAKLMLNSLYGKFATNPDITGKAPYLKDDGSTGFKLMEEEFRDPIYTPMGVFITSYARDFTIRTAQKCYDRIIYCDTDSIHLTGTEIPEVIADIVDSKKLGFWDYETTFKRAKYIRQKTYAQEIYQKFDVNKQKWVGAVESDHERLKFSVTCAGMPDKVKEGVTFDNFKIGFSGWGRLIPKHVSGGIVLVDSMFTIK